MLHFGYKKCIHYMKSLRETLEPEQDEAAKGEAVHIMLGYCKGDSLTKCGYSAKVRPLIDEKVDLLR